MGSTLDLVSSHLERSPYIFYELVMAVSNDTHRRCIVALLYGSPRNMTQNDVDRVEYMFPSLRLELEYLKQSMSLAILCSSVYPSSVCVHACVTI